MKESDNLPPDFVYDHPNGLKVRFGLSYESRKNHPDHGPVEFTLDIEGPDYLRERILKGECSIKVSAHGINENFRRFAVIEAKHAKPLEILGRNFGFSLKTTWPSFYPPENISYTINDVSSEGTDFSIQLPAYAMRSVRLEFLPVEPVGQLD